MDEAPRVPEPLQAFVSKYYNDDGTCKPEAIQSLRELIFCNTDDITFTAMQIALWAAQQTNLLIPARGNIWEDINAKEGESYGLIKHLRSQIEKFKGSESHKDLLNKYIHHLEDKSIKNQLDLKSRFLVDLMVRPILAMSYSAGNCNELAFTAMQCIFILKRNFSTGFDRTIDKLEICSFKQDELSDNHMFVKITAKNTVEIICDPWAMCVDQKDKACTRKRMGYMGEYLYFGDDTKCTYPSSLLNIACEKNIVNPNFDYKDMNSNFNIFTLAEFCNKNPHLENDFIKLVLAKDIPSDLIKLSKEMHAELAVPDVFVADSKVNKSLRSREPNIFFMPRKEFAPKPAPKPPETPTLPPANTNAHKKDDPEKPNIINEHKNF